MAADFTYDVFLSYSSRDRDAVRSLAERLRDDGLSVWFDDWVLKPGDHIQLRIEEGLESSRVLLLCMSEHALGSDWTKLEAGTFRHRDPVNRERRFVPLRLDDAPVKDTLRQFVSIDWREGAREASYHKLVEACRPPHAQRATKASPPPETAVTMVRALGIGGKEYAFTRDGSRALVATDDGPVYVYDVRTGQVVRTLKGHKDWVGTVDWSPRESHAVSAGADGIARLWDTETGVCVAQLKHSNAVDRVAFSHDGRHVLTGARDFKVRVWNVETASCERVLEGHQDVVMGVDWSPDDRRVVSGSEDQMVRVWDLATGDFAVLSGHDDWIWAVAWRPGHSQVLSCSRDKTLALWDLETTLCLRVLEGHTDGIWHAAWHQDGRFALSGSGDRSLRLWDLDEGSCLRVFETIGEVRYVAWAGHTALAGTDEDVLLSIDLSDLVSAGAAPPAEADTERVQYTNAKVLLVGESGAGKTGLARRLTSDDWGPTDSTIGAWATQWKLPISRSDGVEREIWLWDFGGQADQRLIHQLYMDQTAVAVLVFDGQKDDLFDTLGQWDRALSRSSSDDFTRLLVAGRVDAGGLRVSRSQIEDFARERGYDGYLETSAKTAAGCPELKTAILDGIAWDAIPWRSTPLLFKRLKEEIVRLKDEGRVLMRFNELREVLQLRLAGEVEPFTDDELHAVVGLLAGPGVVWELTFGNWVLLQPGLINAYAQAVIRTMRRDELERGAVLEERVLDGDLSYNDVADRLPAEDERFVLLAMHQTLIERGLCAREHTDEGAMLVFPGYYRRERPELVGHPAVLESYRFHGFLDEIYATLVVRLHHTHPFERHELWRSAADFTTLTGKLLGIKLEGRGEGAGQLDVYFEPGVSMEEKIIFSKYVHEHLLERADGVERLRHYVCPHCGTPAGNPEVAMRKRNEGKQDMPCVECDDPAKRIPLWDELEAMFASQQARDTVRVMQEESAEVLASQSRDRSLVGDVVSTVELAGQISRELSPDRGLDMEIEFVSDSGEATGRKVYLLLRSGEAGVPVIPDVGDSPVMLIVKPDDEEARWTSLGDEHGRPERFDVMSVRRWREQALAA